MKNTYVDPIQARINQLTADIKKFEAMLGGPNTNLAELILVSKRDELARVKASKNVEASTQTGYNVATQTMDTEQDIDSSQYHEKPEIKPEPKPETYTQATETEKPDTKESTTQTYYEIEIPEGVSDEVAFRQFQEQTGFPAENIVEFTEKPEQSKSYAQVAKTQPLTRSRTKLKGETWETENQGSQTRKPRKR